MPDAKDALPDTWRTFLKYLLMIYSTEQPGMVPHSPETIAMFEEYGKFTQEVMEAKKFQGGEALMPVATATSIRVRDGKTITTDGPFAETKEQLGGYYLLDCSDLDEALGYAAKIPGARYGTIEVRPVIEM